MQLAVAKEHRIYTYRRKKHSEKNPLNFVTNYLRNSKKKMHGPAEIRTQDLRRVKATS